MENQHGKLLQIEIVVHDARLRCASYWLHSSHIHVVYKNYAMVYRSVTSIVLALEWQFYEFSILHKNVVVFFFIRIFLRILQFLTSLLSLKKGKYIFCIFVCVASVRWFRCCFFIHFQNSLSVYDVAIPNNHIKTLYYLKSIGYVYISHIQWNANNFSLNFIANTNVMEWINVFLVKIDMNTGCIRNK